MPNRSRSRRQLLLLAALFLAPVLGAYVMYFGPGSWLPQGSTAHGQLIDPARPLPDGPWSAGLRGKWSLVHLADGVCGDDCAEQLWQSRQVRTALHRHRDRVQRVYLWPENLPALDAEVRAAHPDLITQAVDRPAYQALRAFVEPLWAPGTVLLVDPLGNWLMVYDEQVSMKGMHKDLKKLLRNSQIG